MKRAIPTFLTVLRILTLAPLAYTLHFWPYLALTVVLAAAFTDWLDGRLARRWNVKTRLGAILDPLADKIFYFLTLVLLRDLVPIFWLLVSTFPSEMILAAIRLPRLQKFLSTSPEANQVGKIKAFLHYTAISIMILGVAQGNHDISMVGMGIGFAAIVLSWKSLLSHLRNKK